MPLPDLNLLIPLHALLTEGNVARAAARLHLSPSATSRALARLREVTGDPLLVRAGRGLVPTPRALALREEVQALLESAQRVLRPESAIDLTRLDRVFTLRASDGFVESFGPALLERAAAEAPLVRLRFLPKPEKDTTPLRTGAVDLEIGVVTEETGPELRTQALFQDRMVGAVRAGHPLLAAPVTAERFAAGDHVLMSRRGVSQGLTDTALAALGLRRRVVVTAGGFSEVLALARSSDLIATVPDRFTRALRDGMVSFPLPFPMPGLTISLLWHPRLDADPGHRWLRDCVRSLCTAQPG
ncbi:LysR family transcriptional regulator [Novispirillum itersonii]|uniref:DNA-binding transcriptional LysR family regulator n=1 Tax=Novispirillum itersonii TaxID=189 RepID=A0A7X0DQ54_NOVIT|nr:LysR family transcriptional regulator [Novispirillum itersonii]MBB6211937.1 DNA-binding transcriptional LysR family regulator [Novispirillum itersonii]